jgi:sulfonate transport system permease protein
MSAISERLSTSPTATRKAGGASRFSWLRFGQGLILPLSVLIIWEIAARAQWVTAHTLPAPSVLLATLKDLLASGALFTHIGVSSARVGAGFVLGGLLALALGAFVALNQTAARLVEPTLQGLRAIPSLAWVPLLLLWLGIDEAPKITLIAMGAFFPVYLGTVAGIHGVDRKLVEVGQQLGLSQSQLARRILLPAALPSITTGARGGLSLSWMFLVAAELIAASKGLGYLLTDGRETGRVDIVLVTIITLAILGKVTDTLAIYGERHLLAWRDVSQHRNED